MYGRLVTYTHSEDRDALEAKARAGVIPIVTAIPGYVAYGVIVEDDRVISMSAWQSEEDAKSGDAALLEWVKNNTTMKVQSRITGDFSWSNSPESSIVRSETSHSAPLFMTGRRNI